jgi:hypothetical protein
MPTSNPVQISKVVQLVRCINPTTILDIGVGFGKMGMLCREYLDIWYKRYDPKSWLKVIDGIEIFKPYKNPIHDFCYNQVIYDDVMNHLDLLSNYNLVLMVDVIEHLPKDEGVTILQSCIQHYILTTPNNKAPRSCRFLGNTHESHLSSWSVDDFKNTKTTVEVVSDKLVVWKKP